MTATPRWGILGTGVIVASMVRGIRTAQAGEIVAIASRDEARARAAAAKHGIPRAIASYEELLAHPGVDAVYVALPISEHVPWALKAIAAGKHALVEKPFALSAPDAERTFAAARARGVVVGEALVTGFHPLARRARALVAEGAIGAVRLARSTFSISIAGEAENFRWRADLGGGAMRDIGCYSVAILRWLIGEEPSGVSAQASFERGVDAEIAAVLRFPSGALATLACGLRSQFDCSYEAFGTAGRLRVDFGGTAAWAGTAFDIELWQGDARRTETIAPFDGYVALAESFARAVREGLAFGHLPAETVAIQRVIDAVLAAAASAPAARR